VPPETARSGIVGSQALIRSAGVALLLAAGSALATSACETFGPLAGLVQAPRFENVPDQPAELQLRGPTISSPLGGANVRLWTRVTNPNPFGFTLTTLTGTLLVEESRAATADFPLGLPLDAGASTTIPIDLSIDFRDVPGLADVVRRAVGNQPIGYALEGTVSVNAGRLGTPAFGPMTLIRGSLR
jgi:hypothetical protein